MNEEVAEFVATLLHSSTVTHFMHWSTDSFANHMALGEYYAQIIELVDQFAAIEFSPKVFEPGQTVVPPS